MATGLGSTDSKIAAIGLGLGVFFGVLIPDVPGAILSGISSAVAGGYISAQSQKQLTEEDVKKWLEGYRRQPNYSLALDSSIQQKIGK